MIQGEKFKTSEKGCWAKYSVDVQFFYNLPFTAWLSLKLTFPRWVPDRFTKEKSFLRLEDRKEVESIMLLVGASVRVPWTPEIPTGMWPPDFILTNDGVSYRNISIMGGLMDLG